MNNFFTAIIFSLVTTSAAAVGVMPIHLNVQDKNKSASVQLSNDLDYPVTIDVRIKKWGNGNSQEETTDVILSRPVVTIPAHGSSTVRAIVKVRSTNAEDTYRILVNDITPAKPGDGLGVKIGFSIPLFVLNDKSSKGTLELVDGQIKNTGNRHARIASYISSDGKKIDEMHYLMPGESILLPAVNVSDITYSDDVY